MPESEELSPESNPFSLDAGTTSTSDPMPDWVTDDSPLSLSMEEHLAVLNPEQKQAVVDEGSALLILAGAGSGKTRVITTKIAYLIAAKHMNPSSILAVTFTKKAANEMHERAVALEPRAEYAQIRTFHSFGAWFLRVNAEAAGVDPNFTVYDDDDMITLITKAKPQLTRAQATHCAHKIALAKDYCMTPADPKLGELESDPEFPEIYRAYEARLHETGNVDFGDLIMKPVLVLKNNADVRHRMHVRFRVIMVDEYQDSNVAQFLLLQALSGVEENAGTYVCVVGDDDQSIYKFRGAEVQNILTFKEKFPGTTLIRLERNYRSTAEILRIADNVVKNNEGRLGKTLTAERGSGKQPKLIFLPNQDEEAQFCADLIQKTHKAGIPYNDWAILYRTNAQSLTFETEFLHRKIPYTVVGSLKFYEREEIKDVLAFLALAANQRDEIAFRRVVNKPARGAGETSQDKIITAGAGGKSLVEACREVGPNLAKKAREGVAHFVELMEQFTLFIGAGSPHQKDPSEKKLSSFIELVNEKSGLVEYYTAQDEIAGTQRAANMQELANSAVLYPCTIAGLLDFLDHIELDKTLELTEEESGTTDSVTLITLHNTKGLEFPRVIITGMEMGIFPRQDKTGAELEEERRLFYVGITRARDELYLTSCAMRRMYGRTDYMEPSPFLLETGRDTLKVLGHAPSSFRMNESDDGFKGGDYGKNGLSDPRTAKNPLEAKFCKGARVYHDDYGYGQIIKTDLSGEGEYVVTIQFESGEKKKFMPEYQAKSLMVVKE
jgi:DNA helicase II / ATP-dependent DNA helicase PcrA